MPESPPWEWVDGDARSAARAAHTFGVLAGVSLAAVVVLAVDLAGLIALRGPPSPQAWTTAAIWSTGAATLALVWFLPRRCAMVERLGISPLGVRLRLTVPLGWATRRDLVVWQDVVRVGDNWIEVLGLRGVGVLPERYRLSPEQGRRLRSFLGLGA